MLLNLKRDIYNERLDCEVEQLAATAFLPTKAQVLIKDYFSLKQAIQRKEETFELEYQNQIFIIRKIFKTLVQDPSFQKGILLSSKSLFKHIDRYLKKQPDQFSRNDFKAELGLLKYLTRLKTKTSPFSTFTNIAVASHSINNQKILQLIGNKSSTHSHVRLNNKIFMYIQTLLFNHPEIYPCFSIRPNPTIRIEGNEYVYLINHNNIESFQRIAFNPILDLILETLNDEKQGLRYKDLIQSLCKHVDASSSELSDYLKKLIEFGFLEFNLGVSGADPDWDLKLREKLLELEHENIPLIKELRDKLHELKIFTERFALAHLEEREKILKEAFATFKNFCLKFHEAAGLPEKDRLSQKDLSKLKKEREHKKKNGLENSNQQTNKNKPFSRQSSTKFLFKPRTLFYEDTSVDVKTKVNLTALKEIVSSLDNLMNYVALFDDSSQEKQKMIDYFVNRYGLDKSVSLLTFYEEYYRDVKKPEAEREDSTVTDEKAALIKWQAEFQKRLENPKISREGVVQFNLDHIKSTSEQFGLQASSQERNSFGMFLQLYSEKGSNGKDQLKGVINGVFPGFGWMISRFLHLFGDNITRELYNWNKKLAINDLLIENCDATHFNANIHPPLMPYQIRMPGSNNTLPEERQIPVTDLFLKISKGEIILFDKKSQNRVYTFHLGFQVLKNHSQLYQLLSNFTFAKFLFPNVIISAINNHYLAKKNNKEEKKPSVIEFYPRIVYENQIILQRKNWSVPVSKLPFQQNGVSDSSYFLRVNNWRKKLKIPDEVFVTVFSKNNSKDFSTKKIKKLGRDDYKPQYINFKNPLLVILFSKLIKKVPIALKIEEMLPDSRNLLKIGEEKYATEFLIQWYHYKN